MWILLPVAGMSIPLLVLVGVGALVGFLSGMFGVSGGFLLTPILMMIGIPPTVAAASDSCQIVAGASSGAGAHFRLGNVDVKLGLTLLVGGLAGGWIGVQIIKVLRALGTADFTITVTYVVMLGAIGSYMFFESLGNLRRGATGSQVAPSFDRAGSAQPAALPDGLPPLPGSSFRHCSLRARWNCGNPGRHHGCGRRVHHNSHDGLSAAHAHAQSGGNQPLPDSLHFRRL